MAAKKKGRSMSAKNAKAKRNAKSKTSTMRHTSAAAGRKSSRVRAASSTGRKRSSASKRRKVGASRQSAAEFASSANDFGIPARSSATRAPDANRAEQQRAADEIRNVPAGTRNPDARQPRSSQSGGRTAGVGARDSGPGSGSGGDIDTDITGVGSEGAGLAQSGPDDDFDDRSNLAQPDR